MLNIGSIIGKFVKNSSQREIDRLKSSVKKIINGMFEIVSREGVENSPPLWELKH